jgi:hypothetical protein
LWLQKKITNFFASLSFVAIFGFGIWDLTSGIQHPRYRIRDLGWVKISVRVYGIHIPDLQHCTYALTIFMPIAHKLGFTNRIRKYSEEKKTATSKSKQTSITTVQNHF